MAVRQIPVQIPLPEDIQIPLTRKAWAAKSEAYAALVAEHLTPDTVWLDAGCGSRLLEDDMDVLEEWLVGHCKSISGLDLSVSSNRNIKSLLQGSVYRIPLPDRSLDLITCRMVVEHLDQPRAAFAEAARCLRPGGTFIVLTPNLINYATIGNAVAAKVLPEKCRLRIVHLFDSRPDADIFPVRYKANTMRRLIRLMEGAGLQVHKTTSLRQQRYYWQKRPSFEKAFRWLTPNNVLLVCAHKPKANLPMPIRMTIPSRERKRLTASSNL